MFSMSITIGPTDPIESRTSMARSTTLAAEPGLILPFFLHDHFGAVLQLSADRAVTSGDHFVARFDAAFYFHVGVVRNPSRHLYHLCLGALLQKNYLCEFFAFHFLHRLFPTFVGQFRVVVAFVPGCRLLF